MHKSILVCFYAAPCSNQRSLVLDVVFVVAFRTLFINSRHSVRVGYFSLLGSCLLHMYTVIQIGCWWV